MGISHAIAYGIAVDIRSVALANDAIAAAVTVVIIVIAIVILVIVILVVVVMMLVVTMIFNTRQAGAPRCHVPLTKKRGSQGFTKEPLTFFPDP